MQRESPWSADDIAEIKVWMKTLQPNRAEKGRAGTQVREPVAEEQTKDYWLMRKYRAQALEAEGELVDADAAVQKATAIFAEARARMLMIPASLRTLCNGVPADEVERIADEQIRTALDDIASRLGDAADAAEDDEGGGAGVADSASAQAQ